VAVGRLCAAVGPMCVPGSLAMPTWPPHPRNLIQTPLTHTSLIQTVCSAWAEVCSRRDAAQALPLLQQATEAYQAALQAEEDALVGGAWIAWRWMVG